MLDFQRRGFINYFTKKTGYEKCEEICRKDPRAIELLIEYLFSKKKVNEAYSVFKRNEALVTNGHILYKFEEQRVSQNGYKLLPNKLRTMDDFLPYEVILDPTKAEAFAKLADYGIQESDVTFIDSSNFAEYREAFLDEPILGLDCEFRDNDCTNFNDTKVATLQVASKTKCAIFDVMDLEKCGGFAEWLQKMLETPSILKIGHSFSGDVKMLNQTFHTQINPQNLVEIEKVLPTKRIKGLKTLMKEYFNKEFCKFNQVSAWFQRPLRRSQVHYAALDAVTMIPLYERLKTVAQDSPQMQPESLSKKKKKKRKKGKGQMDKEENLDEKSKEIK